MPSPPPSRKDLASTLPEEIIEEIFVNVEKGMGQRNLGAAELNAISQELCSFLQVCRHWRASAERRLYHSIFFDFSESAGENVVGKFSGRCEKLLRTLQENEGLALHVHELVLRGRLPKIRFECRWDSENQSDEMTAMIQIIDKCDNLKHFETDGAEEKYIYYLSGAIKKKKGLHTLIVPDPWVPDAEATFTKPFYTPEKLLETLENFTQIREVVVSSFCARRSVATTDLVAHNSTHRFSKRSYKYHLRAPFLRSFLRTWKGPLQEFRGCLVLNDADTYAAMDELLAIQGPHLKMLGLLVKFELPKDIGPCVSLTKSISQLVHLESLVTNSMTVRPTALSSLASLRFLKYEFNFVADLRFFAEMELDDCFLPKVTTVEFRLCTRGDEPVDVDRDCACVYKILKYFNSRGVKIVGKWHDYLDYDEFLEDV